MSEILVIDDTPAVQRAIAAILKHDGYRVTQADDGEEGLRLLEHFHFDLVICDILMPKIHGGQVVAYLNTLPQRPKVIAISGGGADITAQQAIDTVRDKVDGFLEKPFEKEILETMVSTLLATPA